MHDPGESVISEAELRELEGTLLPALERHHLRLLAHGLRTLQAAAAAVTESPELPDRAALQRWAAAQPAIASDPAFRDAFLDQLLGVGVQLERIAAGSGRGPLELELTDLIDWARGQADRRLSAPSAASPPPG
ncbi:MAG: hypothetical protein ACKO25_04300 [Cyanobium sp.]